jgi:hypothetical protein
MPFAVTTTAAVERVLSKLKDVKPAGAGAYMALCPAHDDRQRSLSIKEGTDGRALMRCHAGCATAAIVAAIGLTMGDLFAEPPARARSGAVSMAPAPLNAPAPEKAQGVEERPRHVATYDYTDLNGTLLFQTCRFQFSDGRKTFRQRRPDGTGNWIYKLDGREPVLYRLPAIAEAVALGRTVYVVEGEKDADALAQFGYAATTAPMGAGKWRESYADVLAGTEVVILPDNDEPGRKHAETVAASLHARKCFVKIAVLPDLPPKGDVSDWLAMGRDLDAMEDVIDKTPRWTPDAAEGTRRVLWRLDELWNNDSIMRPPPPIVPRLAWAGRSTLLAAREKSGKSTLVGYIAAAVTRGGYFLNDPCAAGDVLLVGLEEYPGDAARRLRHFDATATRMHLLTGWTGDPRERPQELAEAIDRVGPILVIIDSLAAYSGGLIQDDNNATQMAAVVQPLTDLAHSRGVALVLIHHARKSDGRSRGSTAITAAADVVCEYFAPEEDTDPTLRRMRSAGRVPVVPSYDMRFDGDHYELALSGNAPISTRILAVVSERPGCSINDVAEATRARREEVTREVHQMLTTGVLADIANNRSRPKLVLPTAHNLGLSL